MLEGYYFESNILKDAKDLVVEDNLETVVELYNKAVFSLEIFILTLLSQRELEAVYRALIRT